MPKAHNPAAPEDHMKQAFLQQVNDLWEKHHETFLKFKDEAETKKVTINFRATLDFTEGKAFLETGISYSQVVKDKRREEFEDPSQGTIEFPEGQTEETAAAAENE